MKKLALLFLSLALPLFAAFSLDPVFSSNMVLQQNAPIAFFGQATPGAAVTVDFAGATLATIADFQGGWRVVFPAREASHDVLSVTISSEGEKIELANILIGDVWLCSGQSNMEMPIAKAFKRGWSAQNCEEEVANANYPEIRYADQKNRLSYLKPRQDATYAFGDGWVVCTPDIAHKFSATAYFFIRKIYLDLKIPCGLINATWSGTRIQPWISQEGYENANLQKELDDIAAKTITATTVAQRTAEYTKAVEEYKKKLAELPEDEKKNLKEPARLRLPPSDAQFFSNLYNGMVAPWTKLPIKGVIWYQGCSNAGDKRYYLLHKAMIADWRQKWNSPALPFILVQLASFGGPENWQDIPTADAPYAVIRDMQARLISDPNVGIACAIDIGERTNIHPANKQEVGRRLALEAERIAYGMDIVSRGPMLDKIQVEGKTVRVFYKYAYNGLKTTDGDAPHAFAIAGEDGKFVKADAKIDGNTVVVSAPEIDNPVFVRYAYAAFRGDCNLENTEGLAAYPFRSDIVDYEK